MERHEYAECNGESYGNANHPNRIEAAPLVLDPYDTRDYSNDKTRTEVRRKE